VVSITISLSDSFKSVLRHVVVLVDCVPRICATPRTSGPALLYVFATWKNAWICELD